MKYLLICFLFLLTGCTLFQSTEVDETYDKGATPKELTKAGDNQKAATDNIDEAAKDTKENADKPPVVIKNQDKILAENTKLKANILVFKQEAEVKANWQAERTQLFKKLDDEKKATAEITKERDEYKKRFDGMIGKMSFIFILIGGLAIPLGILATVKLADPQYLWVSVGGALLIVSANVISWIQDNWMWIAGVIFVGVALAVYRMYFTQRRSFKKQLKIGEQLKEEIKALPVEDKEERLDVRKNPRLILTKMFGDKHTDGEAGRDMDPITKKMIAAERRNLEKEWSPYIS
jgi:hypothetical protein